MTRLIFLYIFLNIINCSFGQLQRIEGSPRQLTKKEEKIEAINHNCIYQNKSTARQRLELFPFKKAYKIQIVSFDKPDLIISGGEIPIKDKVVDYSKLKEFKTLSNTEIDTLTDILYNHVYKGPFLTSFKSKCYNPRNAILFIDSSGQVFAFIELCFECNGFRTDSEDVQTGDFCDQKYELLRSFFVRLGIAFGTNYESYEK
ncbi:hypothetical protein [Agriterribacter humi]|uniref:hypothetical protein n=1 Tax=Agriterribacter humi TaxID=1104781 RepID=UPI0012655860|nr:hypothetical protein [Agriterribacter humi]